MLFSLISVSRYGITCSHRSFSAVLQLKMKIVRSPKLGSMLPLKLEPKKEAPLPANNRITALGHTWEDSKIIVIPLTFRFIYAPVHMASAAPSMVSWQPFQELVAPGCLRCSGNLQRSWGRRLGWQEHLHGRDGSCETSPCAVSSV